MQYKGKAIVLLELNTYGYLSHSVAFKLGEGDNCFH